LPQLDTIGMVVNIRKGTGVPPKWVDNLRSELEPDTCMNGETEMTETTKSEEQNDMRFDDVSDSRNKIDEDEDTEPEIDT